MKKAIVLANGQIAQPDVIKRRLDGWRNADTIVVAADGGGRHAELLDLAVDAVIGDLDSIEAAHRAALEQRGTHFESASVHKDETDLELALLYAVGQEAGEIVALGWLGGRLDMTVANIILLAHPLLAGADIRVWEGKQTAWVIRPPGGTISGAPGDTLSLIPLGGEARGISAQHLAYPLNKDTLEFGPARGVSNVLTAPQALVELRSGLLLAVHTPGGANQHHEE